MKQLLENAPAALDVSQLQYQPLQSAVADDIRPILKNLESHDTAVRAAAEAKVEAYVLRNVSTIEKCRRLRNSVAILPMLYLASFIWHKLVLRTHIDNTTLFVELAFFVLFYGCAVVARRAGKRLARIDNARAIPALLDVSLLSGFNSSSLAHIPLINLILRLTSAEYDLIDPRRRKILMGMLSCRFHSYGVVSLKLAILRALEQVGDEEAIPVVEKLAAHSKNADVRKAAIECLPFLRQKAALVTPGRTLLRAAGEHDPEGVLLRPAVENASVLQVQLLRAAANESAP